MRETSGSTVGKMIVCTMLIGVFAGAAGADHHGLVNVRSQYDVATTTNRLEEIVGKKGLTHFTTIDHAAGATGVGESLAPTRVVVFGNPKIGTPLMRCNRTVAIDLPQKALVWRDDTGVVWLSYNNPAYLNARHGLAACAAVLEKVSGALAGLSAYATGSK